MKARNPTLADLPSARVVTVGDVIMDYWVYGRVERISPEAPVPVFMQDHVVTAQGGAGNVVANLSALGIKDDANVLVGNGRWFPPQKHRYVVGNQQIFRVDREEIRPLTDSEADAAYKLATASNSIGCLVLSDYGKGMLTPALCQRLIRWARMFNIPVVVDPKGRDWAKYQGATVVTPNEAEWEPMQGKTSIGYAPTSVLLTRGAKGMQLILEETYTDIPAQAREVFDVTGAGDTVVAVLAAALAVGFEMEPAARLANAAAGVVVSKRGTATCSLEELQIAAHPLVAVRTGAYTDEAIAATRKVIQAASMLMTKSVERPGLHILEGDAEQQVIAMVREKIATLKPAGDINRWETGWKGNLEAFRKTGDIAALRPKYIRDGQPLRLNGKFVIADDPDYEWHWYEKFREQIADKWLKGFEEIWEYGCGSCHNVAWLADHFGGDVRIYGLDWADASIQICDELQNKRNVRGLKFDFFSPPSSIIAPRRDGVVLTVGALEQTGKLWRPFLDYLLAAKPARVVHIEPIVEWYDPSNPVDATAIEAHKKRGFWEGYLDALLDLQANRKIDIETSFRTGFGSLMIEGYSQLIWRPL